MKSSLTKKFDAPTLRLVLLGTIVLLAGVSAVCFWLFYGTLNEYSNKVNQDVTKASVSTHDINKLKALEAQLEDEAVAFTRAKNIVAESREYQYQDQIIEDINAFAKAAGIKIIGYTFSTGTQSGQAATGTTQPSTPPPNGLKVTTASINVESPVDYHSIMKFIRSIELNLTKMEVTGVTLTKTPGTDRVSVAPMIIEVYTR